MISFLKNKTQIGFFSSKTSDTYLKSCFKKKETTKNIFDNLFFNNLVGIKIKKQQILSISVWIIMCKNAFYYSWFDAMEKEYDIRNDEEQEKKSQEVLELLVTAGYFRARIKVNRFFFHPYVLTKFSSCNYSEVSIIRPGRSRLLEFEI